jgi:uncharacterized protein YjiS (DUF1127 family)
MKHFALKHGSVAACARTFVLYPLRRAMASQRRAAARRGLEDLTDHLSRDIGLDQDPIASAVWRETQFLYGPTIL